MHRNFMAWLSRAAATAVILTACSATPAAAPTPAPAASPAPAQAASAQGVSASAKVTPRLVSELGFVVAGPVKEIDVKEGDVVQAGQTLIVLDVPELAYAVTAAEAALQSAQSDEFIQSSGRRKWDGYKWIWAAGPPELRQKAVAATLSAQAGLAAAQAELAQATLTAPYDGTIVSINAAVGELMQPGKAAVVIADLAQLQVETTDLSERDITAVRLGQQAHVQLKAFANELRGVVSAIAPIAGKSSDGDTIYKVTIALNQQPAGLLWGMTGEVRIDTQ